MNIIKTSELLCLMCGALCYGMDVKKESDLDILTVRVIEIELQTRKDCNDVFDKQEIQLIIQDERPVVQQRIVKDSPFRDDKNQKVYARL